MEDEDRFESWWQKEYPEFQSRQISHVTYKNIAEAAWNAALDNAEEIINQTFNGERERRKKLDLPPIEEFIR